MKRVLVTGGAGYVGSVLTGKLLANDYKVRVIDLFLYDPNSLDGYNDEPNLEVINGDIRDEQRVKEVMKDVDVVIHLASISNDPTAELDESITKSVNYDCYPLLLDSAKEAGVQRFINASSSSVFGIKHEENVTEDLEPEPLTTYSKYKALSEVLVREIATPDFVTVNIRPATICGYSPRQRFDLTVNVLTKSALTKGVITIHGGEQMRPNVTMEDITDLYIQMIEIDGEKINGDTFNYGFENLKVIEIAEMVKETVTKDVEIVIEPVVDQRNYHISSQKIIDKLGIRPQYTIVDMIEQLENAFDAGKYPDPDADKYSNIKKMKLEDFK
ncbi:MAG: UDP-glucose 4-epimerase [Melioribacteraceae bacterium]|nr:MAG: UDP-glucose 4-epimerase [Melioribacteraceae bacterium]